MEDGVAARFERGEAEDLYETEGADVLKEKAAEAAQGAREWLGSEAAQELQKKASAALGTDVAAYAGSIGEMQWTAGSLEAFSKTEVPEDVKDNVLAKTGQVWDELCQDEKTRALASTLVSNMSAVGGNEKLVALREGLLSTIESKENVSEVLEKTQGYLSAVYESEDTKQLLTQGSEVWSNIGSNSEFWDKAEALKSKGRGMLGSIKVREGQSVLDAPEIAMMKAEGEELLGALAEDEATKAFLDKSRVVLGELWAQALADLGIEGDISAFIASSKEIWATIDTEALGTGCLELVLEYIPNLEIPDIHGMYSSPTLGEICYSVGALRFASFDFDAQNGIQIKLGNPLSLQLDEIGASVEHFTWQYAKPDGLIAVLGEGEASLTVKEANVHMEYGYKYEEGKVTLTILHHSLALEDLEVVVEGASQSWLYNMLLDMLNTRLKDTLQMQLLELALGKLTQLSKMLNELSSGFLDIKLHANIAHSVQEAEAEDSYRTMQMLTASFGDRYATEPMDVTVRSERRYFTVLPTLPKALLFTAGKGGPDPKRLLKVLRRTAMLGTVSEKQKTLRKRLGVGEGENVLVCYSQDRKSCVRYEGPLEEGAMMAWLQMHCYSPERVHVMDAATCAFFVQHVPPAVPVVVCMGAQPDYWARIAAAIPQLCFTHCSAEAAPALGEHLRLTPCEAPRVVVFTHSSSRAGAAPIVHEGGLGSEEVQEFLQRFIVNENKVVQLTTASVDTFFQKDLAKPKLLLFSSHLGTPELYQKLQKKHKADVWFGIVNQEPDMEKMFKVTKIPTLLAFPGSRKKPEEYRGKICEEGIKAFVAELAHPVDSY